VGKTSVAAEMHVQLTAAKVRHCLIPQITSVLLTCEDATARQCLSQREIGTALDWHIERSEKMARRLNRQAPVTVHRIATDNRTAGGIAAEIISLAAWLPD